MKSNRKPQNRKEPKLKAAVGNCQCGCNCSCDPETCNCNPCNCK